MVRVSKAARAVVLASVLSASAVASADTSAGVSAEELDLKQAAVARLARSLDPAVPIALGKTVVRQAALLKARELLAAHGRRAQLGRDWHVDTPEWRLAERELMRDVDALIEDQISTPRWFYAVLEREIANVLEAEDADYIATHFTTFAGNEQRILLQMRLIAEILMTNYSFTNRIDHTVPGLEEDLTELSNAYWALEPFRKRDFMNDPQAIKFAGQAAGLKYTRMLAIRGIEGFTNHIDAVAVSATTSVENAEPFIEEYIEMYRQRIRAAK